MHLRAGENFFLNGGLVVREMVNLIILPGLQPMLREHYLLPIAGTIGFKF